MCARPPSRSGPGAEGSDEKGAEEQQKLLEAAFSVSFATKIVNTLPFDDAVELLRSEVAKGGVLPNNEDEPLFAYEVVRTGRAASPYGFFSLASPFVALPQQGHPNRLEVLAGQYDIQASETQRLQGFLEALATDPKIEPEGFVVHDYRGYDSARLEPVPKRAVLNLVEKEGRTLLVGSGYRVASQSAPSLHLLLIVGSYLFAWAAISYLFLRGESYTTPVIIGSVGVVLLCLQYSSARTVKGEVTLSEALRSTSVAIAAASLGISIFLRKSLRKTVVVLALFGFFLALFPLILSGVSFGPGTLANVNSVIVVLLALSVSCIVAVLLLMLPSGLATASPSSATPSLQHAASCDSLEGQSDNELAKAAAML